MKYWFLSYVYRMKANPDQATENEFSNVVLADIHPLIWLSTPPEIFRKNYTQYALWYAEIDRQTYEDLQRLNYMSVEPPVRPVYTQPQP